MLLVERDRLNRRLGVRAERVRLARVCRYKLGINKLASMLVTTPDKVQIILDTIDAHPEWDDEDVAENVDF